MRKVIYALIPISILIIIFCTFNIDKQYMWSDEIFSFHAAERIIETKAPTYESGLEYTRSGIYHYLLALSMKIFGENELGSRIINIPFQILTWFIVSLFIYTLLDSVKDIKKKILISYSGGLLYFISNFSIAMLRETRMYAMSTFLLILSIYLIYKAVIKPKKGINIKWLNIKIDIRYLIPAILTTLLAIDTQPINVILGVGLIFYFLLFGLFYRKYKYLIVSILLTSFAYLLMYLKFDTLNILSVFNDLSPQWAMTSSPLYYSVLTVRNLPFVILTSVIAIYLFLKKRNINILYLASLIVGFLGFLSFQSAQHERYWQAVIPIMFILSVYTIYLFYKYLNSKTLKVVLISLISISLIFHIYLSIKEITEINTYTPHSLSIHKKLQFTEVVDYLKENDTDKTYVVGDFHSVYTLIERDIKVDYLLLSEDDVNWQWGEEEIYFDIPIIDIQSLDELSIQKDGYLILRDSNRFQDIPFENFKSFDRPVIYTF